MGSSQTGLVGTIGLTLLSADGTVYRARNTGNIYEIGGGCYGKNISFPDSWAGSLMWDTGGGTPVYAVEGYTTDGLLEDVLLYLVTLVAGATTNNDLLNDITGTGFVKDTDSLVNIRPETDKIDDLHKLQGLDIANPMTVTKNSRIAGTIQQTISGDGETTSTVTRTA